MRRSVVYSTVKTSTCQASLIDTDVGPAQRYEQLFIPVTTPVLNYGVSRSDLHPITLPYFHKQRARQKAAFNPHDARS